MNRKELIKKLYDFVGEISNKKRRCKKEDEKQRLDNTLELINEALEYIIQH